MSVNHGHGLIVTEHEGQMKVRTVDLVSNATSTFNLVKVIDYNT